VEGWPRRKCGCVLCLMNFSSSAESRNPVGFCEDVIVHGKWIGGMFPKSKTFSFFPIFLKHIVSLCTQCCLDGFGYSISFGDHKWDAFIAGKTNVSWKERKHLDYFHCCQPCAAFWGTFHDLIDFYEQAVKRIILFIPCFLALMICWKKVVWLRFLHQDVYYFSCS